MLEYQVPTVYTILDVFFNFKSKETTPRTLPKLKTTLLSIIYKVALVKSQSIEKSTMVNWVSQVIGAFVSCNPYDYERKLKKKFNYKKKKKK